MRPNQGAVPNFNLGGRRLVTLMVGRCVMIPVTVMVTDWREVASRRLNGRDTPTTRANTRAGGATVPCQSNSLLTRRRKTHDQVPAVVALGLCPEVVAARYAPNLGGR